jgi:GH15 family glucan-1,4-alpha-glucosidase
MYRVDGSSDLTEETLGHFERVAGILAAAVRVGNGAANHLQLDIYREALDAILGEDTSLPIAHAGWLALTKIIDWVATTATRPTRGCWRPAAAARTSPTADPSAGSRSAVPSGSPNGTAARPTP